MSLIEKIDKCEYCKNKTEYVYLTNNFFEFKLRLLCDDYRLRITNNEMRV